ncbi:uncharacterized protein LOC118189990 [Stegodyphus dumicola]|uniref:uncharacterized protein LOC118189990 n=1 Tax=Stegodyphus dumicola TaxID=202533 RepID=UPI0015AFCD54|nr:uncharacterized protein LOC118189990 [Stegodyphus dumicola]
MITLTSFQLKLLERLIFWHLQSDNNLKHIFGLDQQGFRPGFSSTESALHQLVWRIEKTIIDGHFAIGILLDIVGAFDNIGFEKIHKALTGSHIHPMITRWVIFMIKNRNICVSLADYEVKRDITKGCPQGGILSPFSPFLWNLVFRLTLSTSTGGTWHVTGLCR